MPETLEAALVLVAAVLPGALHVWAVEREAGRWGIGLSDRLLRFVGTTAVYQAAFAYPLYLVWIEIVHSQTILPSGEVRSVNRLGQGTAPAWFWLLPILYVAIPIAVGTLAGLSVHRRPRLSRILVGRDPAPTAWEFLFSRHREGVIRARLKSDGRWIGGLYGPNSYASGYPEQPQDLLLERTYRLNEDGTFAEGSAEGGFDEVGSAMLIRWEDIAELEFFSTGSEVG